jgi:hypothetical protein
VSSYVSVSTRLRSSSGHGVDWRTGVDCQRTGSFTKESNFCRVHRDVTYGGPGVSVCEQFVFLPTSLNTVSLMTLRWSRVVT